MIARTMANIVITGANRGIGLELARQRAKRDTVIALCREPSAELSALGVRVEAGVEVTDGASVKALASRLSDLSVDVLINNAGILSHEELDELDFEAIRRQFEVNALGPLRLTEALLPRMRRGSKIAIITSRMGSIADNSSGGSYGYRMSKAAVNAAGVSLARDLEKRGVAVALLHPGFVRTGMTGGHGNIDAADSARLLWQRIDALTLESSGTFWHANGEVLPW
jgi:NAD(P)-dependent dehydrogenase (short-subunit alcohol dehydrogenase family)